MSSWELILIVLIVLVIAWAYFTAQRLDRLHVRLDASFARLKAALDRRAAVLSAVDAELKPMAQRAESIDMSLVQFDERLDAERALVRELRQEKHSIPAVIDAEVRVQLALRFYNEAVADTRALRLRPVVRFGRLAGNAPLPQFFEAVDLSSALSGTTN